MTPSGKDTQRRLAVVLAAREKWKDRRIALIELDGRFTLRSLLGTCKETVGADGRRVFTEEHVDSGGINRCYWQGGSLDEAEKVVKS